ncbi:recombination regulator RecX [Rhodococcus ruber]|uniref:Regulatory protein RecX n=2 Tax=Rhodococcus TaxID=1827 RepID=M2YVX0_9NOCA|nr:MULTISPECIES: recombination regulator RecX [Rhodococcus]EME66095.1 recombination regulator RecX [Rhodococcus ruber BKS 20-38]MDM7487676.1 recombination regulator RecX [Rhodococcus indonesiensis]QRE80951.1 recombination regulator RecX [Rhodococcus ruber]
MDGDSRRGDRRGGDRPGGGTEAQAKDLCLRLLTDRARSRAELAAKLEQKGFAADVAERTLDRLTEVGLVDDAEFAQQWVRSRHLYAGKGKRALALELRRKGIGQFEAAEALEQIDGDDERARATELVRKKLRTQPPLPTEGDRREIAAERDRVVRRLVGMLARRGYPQGLAFEVVRNELAGHDPGPGEFATD